MHPEAPLTVFGMCRNAILPLHSAGHCGATAAAEPAATCAPPAAPCLHAVMTSAVAHSMTTVAISARPERSAGGQRRRCIVLRRWRRRRASERLGWRRLEWRRRLGDLKYVASSRRRAGGARAGSAGEFKLKEAGRSRSRRCGGGWAAPIWAAGCRLNHDTAACRLDGAALQQQWRRHCGAMRPSTTVRLEVARSRPYGCEQGSSNPLGLLTLQTALLPRLRPAPGPQKADGHQPLRCASGGSAAGGHRSVVLHRPPITLSLLFSHQCTSCQTQKQKARRTAWRRAQVCCWWHAWGWHPEGRRAGATCACSAASVLSLPLPPCCRPALCCGVTSLAAIKSRRQQCVCWVCVEENWRGYREG